MLKKILNIIRWKNLVFIVLIQLFIRVLVISPILSKFYLELLFSNFHFFLLVLSTVFLAAGGYIINDYFDFELDKNSAKTNYVTSKNKNSVMNWYIVLNIIALALAFFISYKIDFFKLAYIFIIIAGLLWFYSSNFQRSFLFGNIIIALLAALVPLIVLPYEIFLQYTLHRNELIALGENLNVINFWVLGISAFAFLLTLIREIIKDTEDHDADIAQNFNTLPIVLGIKGAKITVISLIFFTIIGLYFVEFAFINFIISAIYISILVVAPLIFSAFKIFKAQTSKDFNFVSKLLKLIMVAGIFYSFVIFLMY